MGAVAQQCQRQCCKTAISIVLQLALVAAFVLLAVWVASWLLEPANLIGITTVPPGLVYVDSDGTRQPLWERTVREAIGR